MTGQGGLLRGLPDFSSYQLPRYNVYKVHDKVIIIGRLLGKWELQFVIWKKERNESPGA